MTRRLFGQTVLAVFGAATLTGARQGTVMPYAGTWLHDALRKCREAGFARLSLNGRTYDARTGNEIVGDDKSDLKYRKHSES